MIEDGRRKTEDGRAKREDGRPKTEDGSFCCSVIISELIRLSGGNQAQE
jgi:hypothetical protein